MPGWGGTRACARRRLLACRLPALPVALKCVCVVTPAARRSGHGATGRRKGLHAPPLRAHEGRSLRAHGCVCVAACLCVTALLCLHVRGCAHVFVFVLVSVCLTVCLCVCVCLRLCVRGCVCLFLQRQTRRHSPASGDPQVAGTSPPGHCPPPAATPRGPVAPGWLSWLLYSQQGQAGVCRSCVCDVPFLLSLVSRSTAPRSQSGLVRPAGSPCPEVPGGDRHVPPCRCRQAGGSLVQTRRPQAAGPWAGTWGRAEAGAAPRLPQA